MTERLIPSGAALLPSLAGTGDRALGDALRRALPVQRLAGNGMDFADAAALHALAEAGVPWTAAAEALGDAADARAREALGSGHRLTARGVLRQASSCYRFAQSALDRDEPEKKRLYARAVALFAEAAALDDPPTARFPVAWRGGTLAAWLMRPPNSGRPPCVVVFGGADGWKEEYHLGACYLVERGIAVLLLDGPGQGETRLVHRVFLTQPPADALSAVVTALLGDGSLGGRVGIWGNSLGGSFAAHAASADPRVAACCVNSGSAAPAEGFSRFPRVQEKLLSMLGGGDAAAVGALLDALALTGGRNRIACPLLVLHGVLDRLFPPESARALYRDAPSADKRLLLWEDGDHCIYNHSHEKHCLVADWFADRLLR